jgi:hypothetical protein
MKLTIQDPQTLPVIPNSYSVEIKVMAGDADYDDRLSVDGFEPGRDEELLEDLLRLLPRIKGFYPSGRGGSWRYSLTRVPGFEPWFLGDDRESFGDEEGEERSEEYSGFRFESEDQKRELLELHGKIGEFYERVYERAQSLGLSKTFYAPEWPNDATTNFEIECDYSSHEVFYYDEHSVKHPVTVEL